MQRRASARRSKRKRPWIRHEPSPVTVSERAARRIAEIVAGEPATPLLRVSVEGGGCSGFQYKFDLGRPSEPDDLVIEREGARVLIDPVSLEYLGRLRDRLRRRPDRLLLQDAQPQRHRLVRLRDKLLDLTALVSARHASDASTRRNDRRLLEG